MALPFGADVPISALRGVNRAIVTISSTETVRDALTKIKEHGIQSLPVLVDGKPAAFLDCSELVAFLVNIFYRQGSVTPDQGDASLEGLTHVALHAADLAVGSGFVHLFLDTPIGTLPKFGTAEPWTPFTSDATLQQLLATLSSGVSRVPVLDASGKLINVISQSTVTHYLADVNRQKSNADVQATCSKTIAELGLDKKKVITVDPAARTLDAFAIMYERHVSAVALIDGTGHIIGNISCKDITALLDDAHGLALPVHDYVNAIRRQNLRAVSPSITVRPDDTFGLVVGKLSVCGIHRMYVTDSVESTSHLIGVISLKDVVRVISRHAI